MRARKLRKRIVQEEDYLPKSSNAEALICLNCPYPKCTQTGKGCKHFISEMQKAREKRNARRNKKG